MDLPGLLEAMSLNDENNSKHTIKMKFTKKQFDAYLVACNIFNSISLDPRFNDFVKEIMGEDIEVKYITTQLVNPIVKSVEKVTNEEIKSLVKKEKGSSKNGPSRESYFTSPVNITAKGRTLYSYVKDNIEFELRHPIKEGFICFTDLRKMLNVYLETNNLKKAQGTIFDSKMQELASETFDQEKEGLLVTYIDEKKTLLIPKGQNKVMHKIIKEIMT